LWRAVVLSTGGGILCWLLLMTLLLPSVNYAKSYAGVAQDISHNLPATTHCVAASVGPDQLASFAYFGNIAFAQTDTARCDFMLLQENSHKPELQTRLGVGGEQWQLIWQGHRQSDRDERFLLYRRVH